MDRPESGGQMSHMIGLAGIGRSDSQYDQIGRSRVAGLVGAARVAVVPIGSPIGNRQSNRQSNRHLYIYIQMSTHFGLHVNCEYKC